MRTLKVGDINVAAVVALALTGALVTIALIAVVGRREPRRSPDRSAGGSDRGHHRGRESRFGLLLWSADARKVIRARRLRPVRSRAYPGNPRGSQRNTAQGSSFSIPIRITTLTTMASTVPTTIYLPSLFTRGASAAVASTFCGDILAARGPLPSCSAVRSLESCSVWGIGHLSSCLVGGLFELGDAR